MDVGVHIIIYGMVQGVGFRYFVHGRATRLGLSGIVRNLYDGSVEIEAEGDRSLLEEFIKEVKIGPRAAHVSGMKIDWKKNEQHFLDFHIE